MGPAESMKKAIEGPNGVIENVYTSTWDGDVLVTSITAPGMERVERRSLDADGTMKVHTTFTMMQGKPAPPAPPGAGPRAPRPRRPADARHAGDAGLHEELLYGAHLVGECRDGFADQARGRLRRDEGECARHGMLRQDGSGGAGLDVT
mgnify:CR=1 FL=1